MTPQKCGVGTPQKCGLRYYIKKILSFSNKPKNIKLKNIKLKNIKLKNIDFLTWVTHNSLKGVI